MSKDFFRDEVSGLEQQVSSLGGMDFRADTAEVARQEALGWEGSFVQGFTKMTLL